MIKSHKRPICYGNFEKKSKIYCKECHHDWGILVKYRTLDDLPIIKIESFSVKDVATGRQSYFRKWKDVDFAMRDFDIEEMPEQDE